MWLRGFLLILHLAMSENRQTSLDARIQELESITATLSADGKSTRADIEKLTVAFDRFSTSVSSWMQQSGRTNWGVFAGFGTLILAIGALASSPFRDNLTRVEGRVDKADEVLQGISASRYTRDEALTETRRMEGLMSQSVRDVDETLQREMRLLDDALQREMRMLLDAPLERLKAVEDVARENQDDLASRSGARFNREDYDKYVLPRLDALDSRMRALEKEISRRGPIIESNQAEE